MHAGSGGPAATVSGPQRHCNFAARLASLSRPGMTGRFGRSGLCFSCASSSVSRRSGWGRPRVRCVAESRPWHGSLRRRSWRNEATARWIRSLSLFWSCWGWSWWSAWSWRTLRYGMHLTASRIGRGFIRTVSRNLECARGARSARIRQSQSTRSKITRWIFCRSSSGIARKVRPLPMNSRMSANICRVAERSSSSQPERGG